MTTRDAAEVVVLGSGVAGLSCALALKRRGVDVVVLTKDAPADSATAWAQGGIAVALDTVSDSTALHRDDTLLAGAGLCDTDAVDVLVVDGPRRVRELVGLGAVFDADEDGDYEVSREGGHSRARVVHAGGAATGAEVERALLAAVAAAGVPVRPRRTAVGLERLDGRCTGVRVVRGDGGSEQWRADHVVLATGGLGRLFALTTSPVQSNGDGIALALDAGVPVADLEFVQFHPTALAIDAFPRPLLSEALRGEGALLVDPDGRRFVDELAPRDVVSRAIAAVMATRSADHVLLDARPVGQFARRFPSLATALAAVGLDPAVDLLPVAPAAHYLCGGVLADLDGATALDGLWAVGEVACNGVHGANRLASNSLLDGLVFGARAGEAIAAGRTGARPTGVLARPGSRGSEGATIELRVLEKAAPASTAVNRPQVVPTVAGLQALFSTRVGVVRDAAGLDDARATLGEYAASLALDAGGDRRLGELAALVRVGSALVDAALVREESRGAHTRAEWNGPRQEWRCRLVHGDADLLETVAVRADGVGDERVAR